MKKILTLLLSLILSCATAFSLTACGDDDAIYVNTNAFFAPFEYYDGTEIKGVDVWVNFTETEDGVLAELRSSKYNINKIAVKYGGGGHEKASGATLKNREAAMLMLSDLDALTEEN